MGEQVVTTTAKDEAGFESARRVNQGLTARLEKRALQWMAGRAPRWVTLARVRRQERPRYGFYVDHMVDVLGAVALMCGLGASGLLHWPTAMAMLIAFLVLSSESYLATYTLQCFELSQGIFGPTEIRILLILGSLAALRSPYSTVFGHRVATLGMAAMAIAVAARHTAQLYRQEPLP